MRRKNYNLLPAAVWWVVGVAAAFFGITSGWKISDSLTQTQAGLPMWGWIAIIIVVVIVLFRARVGSSGGGNIIIYDDD